MCVFKKQSICVTFVIQMCGSKSWRVLSAQNGVLKSSSVESSAYKAPVTSMQQRSELMQERSKVLRERQLPGHAVVDVSLDEETSIKVVETVGVTPIRTVLPSQPEN